jgi:hypothetical protein
MKDITVSQTMLRHAKRDTAVIYTHGNFGKALHAQRVYMVQLLADKSPLRSQPNDSLGGHRAENLASRKPPTSNSLNHRKVRVLGSKGFEFTRKRSFNNIERAAGAIKQWKQWKAVVSSC